MSLLESLIIVSEKAANIARICRKDKHLFNLLIQQKSSEEANSRFVEDFKTLADVLIQETVKYDISKQFPELKDFIKGEENNIFQNKLGDRVTVEVLPTAQETSQLLKTVLNGDEIAAVTLATEVHKKIKLSDVNTKEPIKFDCYYEQIGIWIDPIDATLEYINAIERTENGFYVSGLKCVTVLIGLYDRTTGLPIAGVINQPFHESTYGKCCWGVKTKDLTLYSEEILTNQLNVIVISNSESEDIKNKFKNHGFELVEAAGAGYKILSVIQGKADAYILTKNSTFKWDTCGPQAVLKAIGGNVINFKDLINKGETVEIRYDGELSNKNGIIAYRNEETLQKLMKILN